MALHYGTLHDDSGFWKSIGLYIKETKNMPSKGLYRHVRFRHAPISPVLPLSLLNGLSFGCDIPPAEFRISIAIGDASEAALCISTMLCVWKTPVGPPLYTFGFPCSAGKVVVELCLTQLSSATLLATAFEL